jgi:hypothetical protein
LDGRSAKPSYRGADSMSGSKRLLKAFKDLLAEIDVLPFDAPAKAEVDARKDSWSSLHALSDGRPLI